VTETRLVRDLLDANIALTAQVVELAKLAIGAPVVEYDARAPMYNELVPTEMPGFEISAADDWEDIPARPMGTENVGAQILEFGRPGKDPRAVVEDLPLHMSEEEEDLRFAVAHEIEPPKALSDFLKNLGAPSEAVLIDPLA